MAPPQEFLDNGFVIPRIGILAERVAGERDGANIPVGSPRNPPFISPDDSEVSTPGSGGPTELTGPGLRVQSPPQNRPPARSARYGLRTRDVYDPLENAGGLSSPGLPLGSARIKARQQAREQSDPPVSARRSVPRQFTAAGFEPPEGDLTVGSKCNCTDMGGFPARIDAARPRTTQDSMDLLEDWIGRERSGGKACYAHLHRLGGHLGLKVKQLVTTELRQRLNEIWARRADLVKLKTDRATYQWWRMEARPQRPADAMGHYRYLHNDITLRQDDVKVRWYLEALQKSRRIHGNWENDGTLVVSGCFSWMFRDPEIKTIIDEEFAMYRYHLREKGGQENYGWLRIMIHSLIQQAVRQSPAYYLLYVGLREDHNYKLISYPYYTKYQEPGDKTFFRHIDLNIPKLVKDARGKDLIQGSISFDDETSNDCTELLMGAHRFLGPWWAKVQARLRGKERRVPDGQVIRITSVMWTKEDAEEYKTDFKAQPCKAGDVRISLPHLPHGAIGPATRQRRTVLPWFIGINNDHETLDTVESGTWSQLSAAHRDLVLGPTSPSGLHNMFSSVPYAFPASVPLAGLGPISDALIGRVRWDNPSVLKALATLFDQERCEDYLKQWERQAARCLKEAFTTVVSAEKNCFGVKSYFVNRDQGTLGQRYPDDDCEVDLSRAIEDPTTQYDVKDFAEEGFVDEDEPEVAQASRPTTRRSRTTRQASEGSYDDDLYGVSD